MVNQIINISSEIDTSHTIGEQGSDIETEQGLKRDDLKETENKKKVEEAQLIADQLLKKLISKSDYSSEVMGFLQGIWRQVLCNTYLTQGESSSHWRNLKKISSTLVWSFQVKNCVEEKRVMMKTLPSLLHALSRCMDLINMDAEQKQAVFKMLAIEHAKIIRQSAINSAAGIDKRSALSEKNMIEAQATHGASGPCTCEAKVDYVLDEEITGEIRVVDFNVLGNLDSADVNGEKQPSNGIIKYMDDFSRSVKEGEIKFDDEDLIDLVVQQISSVDRVPSKSEGYVEGGQGLKIGTWVDFDTSGTINKVGELFWKSNMTGKCVFLNSEGLKITTMNVDDLNSELSAGRAQIVEPKI